MPTLTIIRGLPGSGKTSLAMALIVGSRSGGALIETDMFHTINGKYEFRPERQRNAESWARGAAAFRLSQQRDVVVTDVFPTLADIEPYRGIAAHFHADFQVIEVHGPWPDIHDVRAEDRERIIATWEPYPVTAEADHV